MSFDEVLGSQGKVLVEGCVSNVLRVSKYLIRSVMNQKPNVPLEFFSPFLALSQLSFEFHGFVAHLGILYGFLGQGNSGIARRFSILVNRGMTWKKYN
jgi:hypothetical protein